MRLQNYIGAHGNDFFLTKKVPEAMIKISLSLRETFPGIEVKFGILPFSFKIAPELAGVYAVNVFIDDKTLRIKKFLKDKNDLDYGVVFRGAPGSEFEQGYFDSNYIAHNIQNLNKEIRDIDEKTFDDHMFIIYSWVEMPKQ